MRKDKEHRIIGKIILHATLTNQTPVLIGKGEGETTDVEMMRLPDGQPYIPASSIAGCLHQQFITRELALDKAQKKLEKQAMMFWGSESTK